MNIIQQQRYLENLSDSELSALGTQGGNEEIDSYPITLEMTRRSKVRADDEARRKEADPLTIDEKIKREFAGITGADPSMGAEMPPDQMEMADLQRGIATQEMGPQSPMGSQPPMMAAYGGLIPGYSHGDLLTPHPEDLPEGGEGEGEGEVSRSLLSLPFIEDYRTRETRGAEEAEEAEKAAIQAMIHDPARQMAVTHGYSYPEWRDMSEEERAVLTGEIEETRAAIPTAIDIREEDIERRGEEAAAIIELAKSEGRGTDTDSLMRLARSVYSNQGLASVPRRVREIFEGYPAAQEEEAQAQAAEDDYASFEEDLAAFVPTTTGAPDGTGSRTTGFSWSGVPSGNIDRGMELIQGTRDLLTTRTAEDKAAERHREASALATRLGHEELYGTRMERLAELDEQMLTGEEIDSLRTAGLFGDLSSMMLDTSRNPDKYKNVITGITTRDKTIRGDIATQTKEIADLLDKGIIDYNTAQEAYRNVETKRLQDIADLPRTEAINLMKSEIDLLKEKHRGQIDMATAQKEWEGVVNAATITATNYRHDPTVQKFFEDTISDARTKGPGRWALEPEGSEKKRRYDAWQTWIDEAEGRYSEDIIRTSYLGESGIPISKVTTDTRMPLEGIAGMAERAELSNRQKLEQAASNFKALSPEERKVEWDKMTPEQREILWEAIKGSTDTKEPE